jgi:hypothetical protein
LLNDLAALFQAETRQVAAPVGIDSLVQLGPELLRGDFVAGRWKTLQQLKSQIGAIGLRQRERGLEKLVVRYVHGLIIVACTGCGKAIAFTLAGSQRDRG